VQITSRTAASWLPLILLSSTHLWLFQACVSKMSSAQPPGACGNPPLPTLGLLVLSFFELTRGSRVRGAIALVVVAIPILLTIVSEVITG
jgi:hypothetical protein